MRTRSSILEPVAIAMIAVLACLAGATGHAQSLDAVWVANSTNGTAHRIARDGSSITTVQLFAWRPVGVAVDAAGRAWIADQLAGRIQAVDAAGKVVATAVVGGAPTHLAIDLRGYLWCGNMGKGFLRIDSSGKVLGTVAPPGVASAEGLAVDSFGDLWLADSAAGRIWKIDSSSGAALLTINAPQHRSVVVDRLDNIYTVGFGNAVVRKFAPDGTPKGTFPIGVTTVVGMAVDRDGHLWLAPQLNRVLKMSSSGLVLGSFPSGGSGTDYCSGVAVDGAGDIWVANFKSASVTKMRPDGSLVKTYPVGLNPFLVGDASGFQRAVYADPFGDVDGDGHLNHAEAIAHANPFDPKSRPCTIAVGGTQRVGQTATLDYQDHGPNMGGKSYAMACSFSLTGNVILGRKRRIDLRPDMLLYLSLTTPSVFVDFTGALDPAGKARGVIRIPAVKALAGTPIHAAAVTIDPAAPEGIRTIAPTVSFKVLP